MRVTRTLAASVVTSLGGVSLAVGAAAVGIPGADPGDAVYDRLATYPVYLNLPDDMDPALETVAEISAVSPDGNTIAYTDAAQGAVGFLDITDPANPVGLGTLPVSDLGDGSPTSIAIAGNKLLVVVDTSDGSFTAPSGALFVVDLHSHAVLKEIDLGGQPDSIDISKDGKLAAIAIENQRDEDLGDGSLPQLPSGFVQIVRIQGNVNSWTATPIHLTAKDGSPLPILANAGIYEPRDLEPEYVAFKDEPRGNERGLLAVSLQENNGIVLINAVTGTVVSAFSTGSATVGGVDVVEEDTTDQSGTITDVPREPDSIGWIGDHIATANEGDLFGGSRGWTIFDAATGEVVWDAGNTFAEEIVRVGLHNEGRSENKGAEPEGLAVTEIDGVPVVLVGSERSNAVLAYDVSDVTSPVLLQVLPTTNGPEGILPVPSRDLLVISSETDDAGARVRASVSLYGTGEWLGKGWSPAFPQLVSADAENLAAEDDTSPIGWGALGALAADPDVATRLYTATDAAFSPTRILTIDTSTAPAVIDGEITVTENSVPIGLDVEGIAVRAEGGFWLGVEGNGGARINEIVSVDADGAVIKRIPLGTELEDTIGSNGIEGVTATLEDDGVEYVTVAIQRVSKDVPDYTFIGQYNTVTEAWTWSKYLLEDASPNSGTVSGDWVGLSEIVAIDEDSFAVIERDKLNGPDAVLKAVYAFDLPAGSGYATLAGAAAGDAVDKRLVLDVIPLLQATNGWVQEKLEGLTIATDGTVYAITDNDGVDDATGETVFLTLRSADDLFRGLARVIPTL